MKREAAIETRQPASAPPERRTKPLFTTDGVEIPYPFGKRPVEWRTVPKNAVDRLATLRVIDNNGVFVPETLGEQLGKGGQCVVYAGKPGQVLKFSRPRFAERLLVLQELLEQAGISHLPIENGPLALELAREGVVIQKRFSDGAVSLDEIARKGYDESWEDVEGAVAERCGNAAVQQLNEFKEKVNKLNSDINLRDEGYYRGYTIAGDPYITDRVDHLTSIIDSRGGGSWGANIFWHSDMGWFLVDW